MYCVASNQWTWESGDSTYNSTGVWETKGTANAANIPSARSGSVGWTDKSGHLYLFGGSGIPLLSPYNDLWEYTIDPNCGNSCRIAGPIALFQSSDSVICANDCINFTNQSTNATSWQWTFAGANPSSSTAENPQNVCYPIAGNYSVKLIASGAGGSDTLIYSNYIKVSPSPPPPNIIQSGDTLKCSTDPSYTSFQWYYNDTLIAGATNTSYKATKNGNYSVEVSNEFGCKIATGINVILNGLQNFYGNGNTIICSPNPASNELTVYGIPFTTSTSLELYNVLGQKISNTEVPKGEAAITIDVRKLPTGIYFIRMLKENESLWAGRFVKE